MRLKAHNMNHQYSRTSASMANRVAFTCIAVFMLVSTYAADSAVGAPVLTTVAVQDTTVKATATTQANPKETSSKPTESILQPLNLVVTASTTPATTIKTTTKASKPIAAASAVHTVTGVPLTILTTTDAIKPAKSVKQTTKAVIKAQATEALHDEEENDHDSHAESLILSGFTEPKHQMEHPDHPPMGMQHPKREPSPMHPSNHPPPPPPPPHPHIHEPRVQPVHNHHPEPHHHHHGHPPKAGPHHHKMHKPIHHPHNVLMHASLHVSKTNSDGKEKQPSVAFVTGKSPAEPVPASASNDATKEKELTPIQFEILLEKLNGFLRCAYLNQGNCEENLNAAKKAFPIVASLFAKGGDVHHITGENENKIPPNKEAVNPAVAGKDTEKPQGNSGHHPFLGENFRHAWEIPQRLGDNLVHSHRLDGSLFAPNRDHFFPIFVLPLDTNHGAHEMPKPILNRASGKIKKTSDVVEKSSAEKPEKTNAKQITKKAKKTVKKYKKTVKPRGYKSRVNKPRGYKPRAYKPRGYKPKKMMGKMNNHYPFWNSKKFGPKSGPKFGHKAFYGHKHHQYPLKMHPFGMQHPGHFHRLGFIDGPKFMPMRPMFHGYGHPGPIRGPGPMAGSFNEIPFANEGMVEDVPLNGENVEEPLEEESRFAEYPADQTMQQPVQQFESAQPQFAPAQPEFAPAQPQFAPAQPQFAPAQPQFAPAPPAAGGQINLTPETADSMALSQVSHNKNTGTATKMPKSTKTPKSQ